MTITRKTPYFFTGQGKVFISERDTLGNPIGFKDIGRVSEVSLLLKDVIIEHHESRTHQAFRDSIEYLSSDVDISLTVNQVNTETLNIFWNAANKSIDAGSSQEQITVDLGYQYGLSYTKVSNVVITDISGTTTYVEGNNYNIDLDTGTLEIIEDQSQAVIAINCNQELVINYDYDAQHKLCYGVDDRKEYFFRFVGLNIAESNVPVVLECYRVGFYVLNQFKVQGQQSGTLDVRGALMKDALRPKGCQFFKGLIF